MGDLRQAAFNEAQKLAEKQAKAALEFPAPEKPLADLLAGTGIPIQGAALLARKFQQLFERIEVLEARLEFLEHHSG